MLLAWSGHQIFINGAIVALALVVALWSNLMSGSLIARSVSTAGSRRNVNALIGAALAANGLWASYYLCAFAVYEGREHSIFALDVLMGAACVQFFYVAGVGLNLRTNTIAKKTAPAMFAVAALALYFLGLKSLKIDAIKTLSFDVLGWTAVLSVAITAANHFTASTKMTAVRRFLAIALASIAIVTVDLVILSIAGTNAAPYAGGDSKAAIENIVLIVSTVILSAIAIAFANDRREKSRETRIFEMEKLLAKVRESEQMARAADTAKSAFVASVSHELRTPLTAIKGMLELLDGTILECEPRQQLSVARNAADHLFAIVNDLVEQEALEEGKIALVKRPTDLKALVEEALALLRPTINQRPIDMRLIIDGEIPTLIEIDPVRMRQLIFNLVGNAIKFTPEGRIAVRLRTTWLDDKRATIVFEVQDTGIGIAANRLGDIFTRGEQADPSIRTRFGGAGLGLSISKEIARALDGNIRVSSRIDNGSCFTVEFEAQCSEQGTTQPKANISVRSDGRRKHVAGSALVVDDNPAIAYLLSQLLIRAGLNCESAPDGEQALSKFEAQSFDLIVVDLEMPGIGGLETVRRLRNLARGIETPIVMATAKADTATRELCLAAGASAFVAKPIDVPCFLTTVRDLIGIIDNTVLVDGELEPQPQPEPKSDSNLLLDRPTIEQMIRLLGREKALELATFAFDTLSPMLNDAHVSLNEGRVSDVRQAGHAIRSVVGSWGGIASAAVAANLQEVAADPREARTALQQLSVSVELTRQTLTEMLTNVCKVAA
jgi:signal transduction histidine kinase/CheY-like chemotaxis protein